MANWKAPDWKKDGKEEKGIKLRLSDAVAATKNKEADSATELFLNNKGAESMASLESFENLVKLELRGNKFSDLAFLQLNRSLCWLALSNNCLTKFSHLQNMSSLAVIDVSDNRIESLVGLEALSGLKSLIVARNRLATLDGLSAKNNPALETLVLSHNLIRDCSLRGFKELKKLSVGHNKLRAFPNLEKLPALTELRLNGMYLSSVRDSISSLESLSIVDLGNNKFSGVAGLKPLADLPALKSLILLGNPCAPKDADETDGELKSFLEGLPKLEIFNNRRRDGQASSKKKKAKTENGEDAPKEAAGLTPQEGRSGGRGKGEVTGGRGKGKGKGKDGKGKGKGKGDGRGRGKGSDARRQNAGGSAAEAAAGDASGVAEKKTKKAKESKLATASTTSPANDAPRKKGSKRSVEEVPEAEPSKLKRRREAAASTAQQPEEAAASEVVAKKKNHKRTVA
eukprot:CAMPEP_0177443074 /NCGR_PEP_ID=MMETSP0369-20130122/5274_1 /TAXON_ID=447022 ORGANISM="Scrippsiella hangoei-like, Strain SHHI-4" /NCGR_SAMPLE_ID=MMETSP0369 /ASSEMBLY_ACC=CAM_ASM_000364 /LENGTH=455 /DNA_ID=CAMNT_0018915043 /DNA_START=1 /DNA_END=1368 /DNA_ORIENTATION=-